MVPILPTVWLCPVGFYRVWLASRHCRKASVCLLMAGTSAETGCAPACHHGQNPDTERECVCVCLNVQQCRSNTAPLTRDDNIPASSWLVTLCSPHQQDTSLKYRLLVQVAQGGAGKVCSWAQNTSVIGSDPPTNASNQISKVFWCESTKLPSSLFR